MLMCVAIIAVYGLGNFTPTEGWTRQLGVSDIGMIAAGITTLYAFIIYLWPPQKSSGLPALVAFWLFAATTAILIVDGAGTASPFLALWMLVAIFAGIFGLFGLVPLVAAVLSYSAYLWTQGAGVESDVMIIGLAGILPLVVSFALWHRRLPSLKPDSPGRDYRKLASELNEVAGKAEVVINAIADGVIAIDNQGVIQLINPAAQQIIGWGKHDALTLNYRSVLQLQNTVGAEMAASEDPVAIALGTNQEVAREDLIVISKSGKKILTSTIVSPVGQPGSGVIVVFRDVTSSKAEEQAQAEFISTASHEMRTPVASIEGYLGLALNPATATVDDKARDFIQKAHQSAQHLGRLFQDLLDVSRADDGRLTNHPKVIDTTVFVGDIAEGLLQKATEKGLTLTFKPVRHDEDLEGGERRLDPVYHVNVDPDHLREVVANLIENGIKYTPSGTVTVDVTGDTSNVTISITDSGIGIPIEDVPHLFQKFYRVDNTATREIGGTGLGLYLCRRLVEAMGGRIWVESEFGTGSTFFVQLPRLSSEEASRLLVSASLVPADASITHDQRPPAPPITASLQQAPTLQQPIQQLTPQSVPPQPATPPAQEPVTVSVAPQPTNTPLSVIENNRERYALEQRAASMRIPVRDDSQSPH